MGKPFSDLEKRAFTILSNGGDPAQSLDRELASYWRWRLDPSAASHDLPQESIRTNDRKLRDVAIRPFDLDLGNDVFVRTTISERSYAAIGDGTKATLNIQDIAATTTAYRLARYTPPKVYWRTGGGDRPLPRTSRITGRKYTTYFQRSDPGYTAPFGKAAGAERVSARQALIRAALQPAEGTLDLISFSPEKARN